jgi:hypothetical protein
MVISAHFILKNWTLKKRLIAFKELPTPHTGIEIGTQLISTITEWNILNKVAFITVNNASSNNVAIAHVQSILKDQSRSSLNLNGDYFHVRCAAHVINLLFKDGLNNRFDGIANIQDSV